MNTIAGLIQDGYAGGAFNGDGIRSSNAGGNFAIGYGLSSTLGVANFLGQAVDATSVLIRYTVAGDANLDGTVNLADFGLLRAGFGSGTGLWTSGDFNYDGNTNLADFGILRSTFGLSV